MATYVLVHGSAHGGWCYQPVARLLRSAGHDVYTPTLTGLGERAHLLSPDIDLDTHITDIVAVLRYEDLRDVILVGHSYGGTVIIGAADRATDRIAHLVFLDADLPGDGESLSDVFGERMNALRGSGRVVDGVELVLFPGTGPAPYFGVTDQDLIDWMGPKLTPHPYKCFEQPLRLGNQPALSKIPQTHIISDARRALLEDAPMTAKAREAGRLWVIDTGHELMITEPRAVADMLLRLATPQPEDK